MLAGVHVRRLQWRGGLVSAGILLAVVASAACTHRPSPEPIKSSGPPSLSAPSPSKSQDAAATAQSALDAYRNMWKAYQDALAVPDPAYPDLAKYATGKALTTLTKGLQSVKDQGLKGTGAIVVSPKITGFAPANAPTDIEITDCLNDADSHIVRAGPGSPYNDKPGGRHRTTAAVNRQADGTWKVTDFGVQGVGTC
jgi:hypothetical protein